MVVANDLSMDLRRMVQVVVRQMHFSGVVQEQALLLLGLQLLSTTSNR
jgi:hypothetical protein